MTSSASLEILFAESGSQFQLLSDEQRETSLQEALAHWSGKEDIWVFGYGSLVWRPEFEFAERRLALLRGYHRSLCLWSRVNRGTPQRPGLVFGLDAGGSCRGMAYRIRAHTVRRTLTELWKREMPSGAYLPRWLPCSAGDSSGQRITALAFVMDRNQRAYARDLTHEQLLAVVQGACGTYGPCTEYVVETANALEKAGIRDRKLELIVRDLQALTVS